MLKLRLKTDNDAFARDGTYEVARILRDAAAIIERGIDSSPLFDMNGNQVGSFTLKITAEG